jgi:hypothetical protein
VCGESEGGIPGKGSSMKGAEAEVLSSLNLFLFLVHDVQVGRGVLAVFERWTETTTGRNLSHIGYVVCEVFIQPDKPILLLGVFNPFIVNAITAIVGLYLIFYYLGFFSFPFFFLYLTSLD